MRQIIFMGNMYGIITELFGGESDSLAERVSLCLLGSADRVGLPRKTDSIFSASRAPRAGHGARPSARVGGRAPGPTPRRPSPAGARSARRSGSENTPPAETNTILLCYTRKREKKRKKLSSGTELSSPNCAKTPKSDASVRKKGPVIPP